MSNWNLLKEGTIKSFSIKEQAESFYKLRPREWVLLGAMLLATIISFAFGGFFDFYSWVGLVTSVATAISLILVDRGFITNYFWGFIGSVAWLIVSIHNNLIGNIVVSIVASAVSPLSSLILYFAYWTSLGYLYNKYYIESLIKKGYKPETDQDKNTLEGINVKF